MVLLNPEVHGSRYSCIGRITGGKISRRENHFVVWSHWVLAQYENTHSRARPFAVIYVNYRKRIFNGIIALTFSRPVFPGRHLRGVLSCGHYGFAVLQVIILPGLTSSGSVIAALPVVADGETSGSLSPMFTSLVNLPAVIPHCAGIGVGLICGLTRLLVTRRDSAVYRHSRDDGLCPRSGAIANPIGFLSDSFTSIGRGDPVIIFFVIAALFPSR